MGFTFGDNWMRFSHTLDEERLSEAQKGLYGLVEPDWLRGRSFIDIGAGSGLFSIAAVKSGARPVVALDRDEQCVTVAQQNANRFLTPDEISELEIRCADILRPESLGDSTFDIVHAWGSLHHTGAMWTAIANAAVLCRNGGYLILAIYNRTPASPIWLRIKHIYHAVPVPLEFAMAATLTAVRSTIRIATGKHPLRTGRGMNVWHDAIDWLGGLPYEFATAKELTEALDGLGFTPVRARLTRRTGCNEFTFRKRPS
jgi:2-polyprenyl-6-hydroxyphenyl methylase/3-demethylubiquinone-9 3-methyltransferase